MSPEAAPAPPAPPGAGAAGAASAADALLARRERKARDGSLILPLAGLVLLMPPAASILAVEGSVLGVPLVVAHVFAVWAALILAALRIARALGPGLPPPPGRGR